MIERRPQSGFTLMELLISVAIIAVVAAFSIPAFGDLIARQRLTASANEALSVAAHARSEAIRQRERVVICPSTNGTSCSNSTDWTRAIVFVDLNRNGTRDGNETITRQWDFSDTPVSATQTGGGTQRRIVVGGTGLIVPPQGAGHAEILFCSSRTDSLSIHVAARVGGVRSERGDPDDC